MKNSNVIMSDFHHGHNIRRLRDMLGIKQQVIAESINMSQQNFSKLEQKQIIDDVTLEKVAEIMKIPSEVIKNFNEDGVINIISSTLHDNSGSVMYNPTFNSVEKIVELYEKLIITKDEQIALLQKMLKEKES
jgi:transcriptional regulator with XRE-family HTH domain